MPYIKKLSGYDNNFVFRIIDGDDAETSFTQNQYTQWKSINPDATVEDLQALLDQIVVKVPGGKAYFHAFDLDNPTLAIIVSDMDVDISSDWWNP